MWNHRQFLAEEMAKLVPPWRIEDCSGRQAEVNATGGLQPALSKGKIPNGRMVLQLREDDDHGIWIG